MQRFAQCSQLNHRTIPLANRTPNSLEAFVICFRLAIHFSRSWRGGEQLLLNFSKRDSFHCSIWSVLKKVLSYRLSSKTIFVFLLAKRLFWNILMVISFFHRTFFFCTLQNIVQGRMHRSLYRDWYVFLQNDRRFFNSVIRLDIVSLRRCDSDRHDCTIQRTFCREIFTNLLDKN